MNLFRSFLLAVNSCSDYACSAHKEKCHPQFHMAVISRLRSLRIAIGCLFRLNGQHSRIGGNAVPELICYHAAHGQTVLFKLNRFDAVGILMGSSQRYKLVIKLISAGDNFATAA